MPSVSFGNPRAFDLLQGLDPSPALYSPLSFSQQTGNPNRWVASPDGTKAILSGGNVNSSTETYLVTDTEMLTAQQVTLASGGHYGSAISNTHYAVCSATSKLTVATFAGVTVPLQDVGTMGTTLCCAFSPDGTKLAVRHSTSPGFREYNILDGTYRNAGAITYGSISDLESHVTYTASGDYIVFTHSTSSNNSVTVLNASDLSVAFYMTGIAWWYSCCPIPDPLNGHSVFVCIHSWANSTSKQIARINCATGVDTPLPSPVTNLSITAIAADPSENRLYASHGPWTRDGKSRRISWLHLDTLAWGPPVEHGLYGADTHQRNKMIVTGANPYRITGSVRDVSNAPAARVVRAYRRSDGKLVGSTISDAASGDYTLWLPDAGPFDVQFMTESGEQLNDLFYARSEPELVG